MDLAEEVYRLTEDFPGAERFGIVSQMRRAAVSIPSNLAEGSARGHRNEWRQFSRIAYGSAMELETQLALSKRLRMVAEHRFLHAEDMLGHILRQLNALCESLAAKD